MICIISDIHSNYSALLAIDKYLNDNNIKTVLCAGDIVGYYTRPNETINWLRKKNAISVLGNHDKAIFVRDVSTKFNIYAKQACAWTKRKLTKKNFEYLTNLESEFKGNILGKKSYMVHGSPINAFEDYLYEKDIDEVFFKKYFNEPYDLIISGQTHIPFIKKIEDTILINPGSVGQPRDGDARTCFAVYNEKKHEAEIIRLDYDFTDIVKETRDELSEYLAQRLINGK